MRRNRTKTLGEDTWTLASPSASNRCATTSSTSSTRTSFRTNGSYRSRSKRAIAGTETPIMEELKESAQEARPVELLPAALRTRRRAQQPRLLAPRRNHGHVSDVVGSVQLRGARHRQHGSDRALRHRRAEGRWLKPLLDGKIRSAFCMTEPLVASSDATNISLEARLEGDEWVLNGQKWWSSGIGDPRCKILIVMCVTEPDAPRHSRQSQILVPRDAKGIEIIKMQTVFGYDDAPHGHGHVRFTNVRVPKDNIMLGSGRGFEIAQGRLGPGRIHHCMRSIGVAERALELMCRRAVSRVAFGKPLADLGGNLDKIADARINIEMARLLTLKAAYMMDTVGNKVARSEIAQIKVAVPNIALQGDRRRDPDARRRRRVAGIPARKMYAGMRTLRLADGPDEVHRRTVARMELGKYPDKEPPRTDPW